MQKTVLDNGFVRLDDFAGGDLNVVNSARVSYGRKHKQMEEGDDKLINFLMKNRHGTPFESSWFHFHIKAPIFVAREWMRHRVASYNEISGRYVKLEHDFYVPSGKFVRVQEGKPGQYKFKPIYDPPKEYQVRSLIESAYAKAYASYEELMKLGIAKEVARNVLPVGIYTEFYFSTNARALMNFLELRMGEHALSEIREYATIMDEMFKQKMPVTHQCFENNERVAP